MLFLMPNRINALKVLKEQEKMKCNKTGYCAAKQYRHAGMLCCHLWNVVEAAKKHIAI